MNIIQLTQQNFDEVVEKHNFLVIDFWAKWCVPCRSFSKVVEKVAEQYPEFVFGTVDIDVEKELAEEFNIRSVPSIMILRDKVIIFAESGALTASSLIDLLKQTKALKSEDLKKAIKAKNKEKTANKNC